MSGDRLTLGAMAALAVAGVVRRRRGGANEGDWKTIDRAVDLRHALAQKIAEGHWGEPVTQQDMEGWSLANYPIHQDAIAWWESATGLEYLGAGASRVASRMPDGRVLKVAVDSWGEQSNRREIEAWLEYSEDPEVRDFLVPIIAGNEGWILMDYATPIDEQARPQWQRRVEEFDRLYWLDRHGIDDTDKRNWGVHEGRVRMVDYQEPG